MGSSVGLTGRIMGGIGDVFVERAMTELLVASINILDVNVKAVESNNRHSVITPEEVSHKFYIVIEKAKYMLRVKTQKGIRHAVHPLHRGYIVDHMHLNRKHLNSQFHTDQLLAKTKYLEGNTGACIYTTEIFTVAYPFIKCLEVVDTL